MQRSVKKTMLWGSLGILFLIGALIVLPWFLNPDYLQSLVLRHIQETFGSHVQVGHTSLAFFPSPHFLVSDIVVKERADSHAVFRAQSLSLKLGIGKLLRKKIAVNEFILDYPEIEIHRDRLGVWRFLGYAHEDSPVSFLTSFFVLGKIEVTNGKIIIIDESPSEAVRGMVFDNVECMFDMTYEDVSVLSTLTLSGKLRQSQDSASFRLSGTFEATSNVPLSSLDREHMSFEHMTFSGRMGTRNVGINQLAKYGPYGEIFAKFPGTLNLDSDLKWVKKGETSQLQFLNIALTNPSLTFSGNASIEGLEDGHQMTSVSLRSSSLNLQMVRQVIPKAWVPAQFENLWNQGEWGGELKVLDARVTSSTRADVGTSVTGTFQVNNGFLNLPEWPNTQQVQGRIVVEPDRIHVSGTQGTYDGIVVDVTKGVLLLNEAGAWGDVEIQGQVPAAKVWNFVRDVVGPSADSLNWQSLHVSQGHGLLRLRFSGEVFGEQRLTFQDGYYEPTSAVVRIPGLPHPLSNVRGTIQFSPDSTVLENIAGQMGDYPFIVNGVLIHQDYLRLEPLTMKAGINGQELLTQFSLSSSESGLHITGPLQASVTMRGPISRLNVKGTIDGEKATLAIPSLLRKEAGQAAVLEFEGHVHSGETVRFERIELAMLPIRIRGQGVGRFHPIWRWEGRLDSGPISLGVLPEKIQLFGHSIESGIVEVQLSGNGMGHDWTKWHMKGWVALTDGVLRIPGISESVENVFVRLRVDKDILDLKRMEFHIQDSEAVITGFVKQWKTSPQVSMLWNAPQFDLALLIPQG